MKPFERRVSSLYGAPMGRASDRLVDVRGKLHLQRVPFVDGDYDQGGAYWGGGRGTLPLFCAWGEAVDGTVEHYLRAHDRHEAKETLLAKFPGLTFYR